MSEIHIDPAHPDEPELELRVLEEDENVPPRPEEEIADVLRSEPDPHEVRSQDPAS
ncbi:hypothetical protein [Serinibacter arcticus]|uniref:hypothetical protein n=1 Tax=Serinibacter arcticus TaxID=1655435 RepID=UPI0018EE9A7D|nr:hypothetical protein [Serinibacter arcticus]